MFKTKIMIGIMAVFGISIISSPKVSAQTIVTSGNGFHNPMSQPACDPSADFSIQQTQVLLSHDQGGAVVGPLDIEIDAGKYDITALSFDDHSQSPKDPDQDIESWFFEGYKDNVRVYRSPVTTDVPNDQDTILSIFGKVTLPDIDQVVWVHAGYPEPQNTAPKYNSVYASCLNFKKVIGIDLPAYECSITTELLSVKNLKINIAPSTNFLQGNIEIDFGDGSTNQAINYPLDTSIDHLYANYGSYTVKARLLGDDDVELAVCTRTITLIQSGSVLGVTTGTPNPSTTSGAGGAVLGASTLQATGEGSLYTVIAGLLVVAVTAFLIKRPKTEKVEIENDLK